MLSHFPLSAPLVQSLLDNFFFYFENFFFKSEKKKKQILELRPTVVVPVKKQIIELPSVAVQILN